MTSGVTGGMTNLLGGLRARRAGREGLVSLHAVLDALGENGLMDRRHACVPLSAIVGTGADARVADFDGEFRLRNPALDDRWQRLACAMRSGTPVPPVRLIQVGEMYFVLDGHHRVSVSRALGRPDIPAQVQRICTIAFALACLRAAHLQGKAAERRFLERVPLPTDVRADLWLDEPSAWARLADSAEAWGFRRSLDGRPIRDRGELAEAWWSEEVMPVVEGRRAAGDRPTGRDVAVYVESLAEQARGRAAVA
ncbi:MAG: hypothetical protein ACRDYU_06710 [Actinomycetes bacterium]